MFAGPAGFADALLTAVDTPGPDRREAGRRLARAHSWDIAAEQHELVYRLLSSAPSVGWHATLGYRADVDAVAPRPLSPDTEETS